MSVDGGFPRPLSASLPPSGPTASQNSIWYGKAKQDGDGTAEGALNPDEGTELTSTSTGADTPLPLGANESPLANLGTLQNALPDVPGKGGTSD